MCVSMELRVQVGCSPVSWLPASGALLLLAHPHRKMANWTLPLVQVLNGMLTFSIVRCLQSVSDFIPEPQMSAAIEKMWETDSPPMWLA